MKPLYSTTEPANSIPDSFTGLSDEQGAAHIEWHGQRVDRMSDRHLQNCCNYLARKYGTGTKWTNVTIAERTPSEWYDVFRREIQCRGRSRQMAKQLAEQSEEIKRQLDPSIWNYSWAKNEPEPSKQSEQRKESPVVGTSKIEIETDPTLCTDKAGTCDGAPDHRQFCKCPNCVGRRQVVYLTRKAALDRQMARAEALLARGAVYRPFLTKVASGGRKALRVALDLLLGAVIGGLTGLGVCDVAHTFISPQIGTGRSILSHLTGGE